MKLCGIAAVFLAAGLMGPPLARAELIPVPNYSFESPQITYAQAGATDWTTGGPATFGAGVFLNPRPGQAGNISNAVGNQLAFISTLSGTQFSQVLGAEFDPDQRYTLSVGVAKSLVSPPGDGDTLRIELYYLDGSGAPQPVSFTDVVNNAVTGLSNSQLMYFSTQTPPAQPGDASANEPIGILFTTTGSGGYLDLDNVTLTALLLGDVTGDGSVDFQDLLILAQHYGRPGDFSDGDFNGDGAVDFRDLLILAQHYGQTQAAAATTVAVPEPSGLAALILSFGCLGRRRRP